MRREHYMRGGMLFAHCRGAEMRILSFCIDDPEQGPVVMLPIVDAFDWRFAARLKYALWRLRDAANRAGHVQTL